MSKSVEPDVIAKLSKENSQSAWAKQFFAKVAASTVTLDRVIDKYLVDFEKEAQPDGAALPAPE